MNAAPSNPPPADLESTALLLNRARRGDDLAREQLASRYYQILRRFAHGRLPGNARGMLETNDLVQVTVMRALDHLDKFEPQREGAFLAYLRRILINQIRDEIRRAARRPVLESELESLPDDRPSPLEEVVGRESLERFENALAALPDKQKEAIIMRVELGFSHQEIADGLGIKTANAARMYVARAIAALAEQMKAPEPNP